MEISKNSIAKEQQKPEMEVQSNTTPQKITKLGEDTHWVVYFMDKQFDQRDQKIEQLRNDMNQHFDLLRAAMKEESAILRAAIKEESAILRAAIKEESERREQQFKELYKHLKWFVGATIAGTAALIALLQFITMFLAK